MKKHIVLTTALMLCLCHLRAQQGAQVSASLEAKFSQKFSTAEDINWNRTDNVAFARFRYQDHTWVAYYDNSEQLVAIARKIREPLHLPLLVSQSLDDFRQHRAAGMKLGPIFELIQEGNTRYLVTLDGPDQTYTITINSTGGRTMIDKDKKADSFRRSDKDNLIARRIRR